MSPHWDGAFYAVQSAIMHTEFEQDLFGRPLNEDMDITQLMTHSLLGWGLTNRRLKKEKTDGGHVDGCWQPLMWPLHPALSSAVTGGADSGVAELGHRGHHRCTHRGGIEAVFPISHLAATYPAAKTVATAASEGGQQCLAKPCVHKAVNDGVDAGGRVG